MNNKKGNRIIQIILLVIIACGFALIALILKSGSGKGGGYGGAAGGGMPGGGRPQPGIAREQGNDSNGKQATAVEAFTVIRQTVSTFIKVNADVASEVSVDIFPDAAGKVEELPAKLGQYIHKGDSVAVVNPSVPGRIYKPSPVLSTISGTITSVNANVGDKVSTASSIVVVGDLSNLTLITYIPERYLTHLKTGLNAEVGFAAFPNKVFHARVIQLNPVLDKASRSLETKLEILDPSPEIRVGMFASMRLVTQESKNTLAVPPTGITEYYGDPVVFVINENNIAERRKVKTGLVSDTLVEIVQGLKAGETIASQGISSLTDGTPVRIVQPVSDTEE
ncbi:MAG: efflux RND transporter periplasmic adaptor subunit [Spirochaetales bacterium]|nr:efflux RND transporter periplasmic adaptor subunit [Spirochaetales bacterium]